MAFVCRYSRASLIHCRGDMLELLFNLALGSQYFTALCHKSGEILEMFIFLQYSRTDRDAYVYLSSVRCTDWWWLMRTAASWASSLCRTSSRHLFSTPQVSMLSIPKAHFEQDPPPPILSRPSHRYYRHCYLCWGQEDDA